MATKKIIEVDVVNSLLDSDTIFINSGNSLKQISKSNLVMKGTDGGYYAPSVDADGNLTWTASKTNMPAVDGANIKGPKGDTGTQGPQGPQGPKGNTGATGPAGADGKSAYAYAVEGGYTGTETEFAAKLAKEYHGIVEATGGTVTEGNLVVWDVDSSLVRDGGAVPIKLPNPNALTFTGAVTGSYDGSQPITVNIPSGGGGDSPWRLIKTVTLAETVKSITVDTDSDGNAFSLSEIYINTNVTNSEDQTVATSFSLKINGKNTHSIGTTAGLYVQCGKTGETGRNWLWLMSLNPLRALHGTWMASNTASGKTVQCYQPNEFGDTNPNPHSVGEKITSITIGGMASTAYMSAGSEFRIYGR